GGVVAPDGRRCAVLGPWRSVLRVRCQRVARVLPTGGAGRGVVEAFAVALGLCPTLSTAVISILFAALRLLGFRPRDALLACLGIGLASLYWHYARTGQEESLAALAFAVWLLGAARLAAGRSWPAALLGGGAAIALATRWASVPMLAVLGLASLVLLVRHRSRVKAADVALGAAIVAVCITLLLLYNQVRFGTPWQTGYGIWYAHEHLTMFHLDGYG